jgi:GTPase Era involved in 16S rRNA processing
MKRDELTGKLGLRVRGGLGTRDEQEAQGLVSEMNQILSDESYWHLGAKDLASQKFSNRIVELFYRDLEPEVFDHEAIREMYMPIPKSTESDYRTVLLLGTTGAGKTTLVRQIIGTDPDTDRFPSTSTSRTTIADTEIILQEGEFKAIVTFRLQEEIRDALEQAALAAAHGAFRDEDDVRVMRRLLVDPDQRLRFNFVLGDGGLHKSTTEVDDFDFDRIIDDESVDGELSNDDDRDLQGLEGSENTTTVLQHAVQTIRRIAKKHGDQVRSELGAETSDEIKVADDIFEEALEHYVHGDNDFQSILDQIMDEIEKRFEYLDVGEIKRRKGWPGEWTWSSTDRGEFIDKIRTFSSNNASSFGTLLTPLVNGMRIAGPFKPLWMESGLPPLVLMDSEGLGHTSESAASISTSVIKKFEQVDAVLLVDNSEQPMLAATESAMSALVATGNASKLLFAFSHFDLVKGDNIRSLDAKKQHVIGSVEHAVLSIGQRLGMTAERSLRERLEVGTFFLASIQNELDPKTAGGRFTIQNLSELLSAIDDINEGNVRVRETIKPWYDRLNLAFSIQKATEAFHEYWTPKIGLRYDPGVTKEHWTRIKALSRRFATGWNDEYDTLRPVADLSRELRDQIYTFIAKPLRWDGDPSQDERLEIINRFAREVNRRVLSIASRRLGDDLRGEWQSAYYLSGRGSTVERALAISKRIYDKAAAIPEATPAQESSELFRDVVDALTESAEVVEVGLQ